MVTQRRRRVRGTGRLERRGDRYRVRYKLPSGEEVTKTVSSAEEGEKLLMAMRSVAYKAELKGYFDPPQEMTLAVWGTGWMERRAERVASPVKDRSLWRLYIEGSTLAVMPLRAIRTSHVVAWLDALESRRGARGQLLSEQSLVHALNLLRKCLGDARRAGHIDTNPASGIRPQRKDPEHEMLYLTSDEISAVKGCEAIPLRARCCYLFAAHTGLRAGELWALRWSDITLEGPRLEVNVRRSHDRQTTKGGRGRTVPLLAPALEALNELRALGDFTSEPEDLVFPALRGGQRHPNDDHGWSSRKVRGVPRVGHRELAGVRSVVRFHDLRHTCASHLAMGTWTQRPLELAVVQRVMGHQSITTTMRYAHLAPGYVHDAMRGTPGAAPMLSPEVGVTGRPRAVFNAHSIERATPAFLAPPTGIEPVTFGLGSLAAGRENGLISRRFMRRTYRCCTDHDRRRVDRGERALAPS